MKLAADRNLEQKQEKQLCWGVDRASFTRQHGKKCGKKLF